MDRRKTGLAVMVLTRCLATAMAVLGGTAVPVHGQTTLFQEPEIVVVAAEGNVARMRTLLAQNPGVNAQDSKGRTALIVAAVGGKTDIAALLLDAGARTDISDRSGNGPLGWAASQGESEIIRLLLIMTSHWETITIVKSICFTSRPW